MSLEEKWAEKSVKDIGDKEIENTWSETQSPNFKKTQPNKSYI